jgi:DNA-binding response OmpR family regulator
MTRIIVVEDDIRQQEELLSFLKHAKHEVRGASDGAELESCLSQFSPEIVLLDYNLTGESGAALAGKLRERFGATIGIVMITARSMGADRIECRRAGADNYLVKPVDFGELLALIDNLQARLTPPQPLSTKSLSDAPWRLMVAQSELVSPGAAAIPLTAWEVTLLEAIAGAQDQIASRDALIRALGKNPIYYDPRALEAVMSRLRRKLPALEENRNPLEAVRSVGYKFIRPLVVMR